MQFQWLPDLATAVLLMFEMWNNFQVYNIWHPLAGKESNKPTGNFPNIPLNHLEMNNYNLNQSLSQRLFFMLLGGDETMR